MCKGTLSNRDNEANAEIRNEKELFCGCQKWYGWHTGENGNEFNYDIEPTRSIEPPACADIRPMLVLADNRHPDKPFLTADYDILTTGFFCPEGKFSSHPACQAEVKVAAQGQKCIEPTRIVHADYGEGKPPNPWPCFDPHTGLITEAQKDLIKKLNKAVRDNGYPGGDVSHHGPETQFFESPYVDYPITIFDPKGPNGEPLIISIPKGPDGFRDVHLKRYYEKKIRQGYWLYPNTYDTANWNWQPRGTPDEWIGWLYADHESISHKDDVDEIKPPPCVQKEIDRLAKLRRGENADSVPPCEQNIE